MNKALFFVFTSVLLTACSNLPFHPTKSVQKTTMTQATQTISFDSPYDFATTKQKIITALTDKNMTIFAEIDHQAAATKAGLAMQPATVIVFGAPKVGTPYMVKDPKFALELPLKVLVTETNGKAQVFIKDTQALVSGTNLSHDEVKDTLGKAPLVIQNAIK